MAPRARRRCRRWPPVTRLHVASVLPKVTADMVVRWEPGVDPRDAEEAVKQAARHAIQRYRDLANDAEAGS